ncbi:MAG: MFS transporter, partial [Gammaproteobacteria bacterium]|nr:MFS transporter [Gammaproteobacteria bacterium]
MTGTHNNKAGNYRVLTILSLLSTCGAAVYFIAPLLVGGYVTQLGFSSQQGGYIISAELAGFALAPIPAAIWVRRISWRTALYLAAGSIILMNLVTSSLIGFSLFLVVRFLSGFAAGIQLAVCMAVIHRTLDPDRNLGYWFGLQLLAGSVGVIFLPGLIADFSVGSVFLLLAGLHALLLLFIRFIPDSGEIEQMPEVKATGSVPVLVALGFAGLFLFEAGIMGVWTYYERIGNAGGIAARTIGYALSASLFLGFIGSMAAAALSTRFNRLVPVVAGTGLAIFCTALLLTDFSTAAYVISIGLFSFAWYFTLPYLMACIANVDATGRLLILSNLVTGLGTSVGPACAAFLQTSDSYVPVLWMGIITILASILFISRLALQP